MLKSNNLTFKKAAINFKTTTPELTVRQVKCILNYVTYYLGELFNTESDIKVERE